MPSGIRDTDANTVVNNYFDTVLPNPVYLDFLTTAPTDDNGTGAVSWGQGRVSVNPTNAAIIPNASGRSTTSAVITGATNSSGDAITVVACAWYTAASSGTYLGGAPVSGGSVDVPDGTAPTVTATLSSPSPS